MLAEIYSKDNCKYCVSAKALLERKGIDYVEIDAPSHMEALVERMAAALQPRPRTVPQIFIDGEYVGGFDKLSEKFS